MFRLLILIVGLLRIYSSFLCIGAQVAAMSRLLGDRPKRGQSGTPAGSKGSVATEQAEQYLRGVLSSTTVPSSRLFRDLSSTELRTLTLLLTR